MSMKQSMGASVPAKALGEHENKEVRSEAPTVEIFSLDQPPLLISDYQTPSGEWAAMDLIEP